MVGVGIPIETQLFLMELKLILQEEDYRTTKSLALLGMSLHRNI
jgi:hypothetical protein